MIDTASFKNDRPVVEKTAKHIMQSVSFQETILEASRRVHLFGKKSFRLTGRSKNKTP